MKPNKIFGIGLSKTGTTSLFAALSILGYRAETYRHLRERSLNEWFKGDFSHDYLSELDAVTDLPIGAFYPALDIRYPGSKFILTTRNKTDWLESCSKFFAPTKMYLEKLGSFRDFSQISAYGVVSYNEALFSYAYDTHMSGVRSYFSNRPEDLLTMSIVDGEGWEKLCPFLEEEIPNHEFPKTLPGGFLLPREVQARQRKDRFILPKIIKKPKKLMRKITKQMFS